MSAVRPLREQLRFGRDDIAVRIVRVGAFVAVLAAGVQTAAHLANRAWIGTPSLNADVDGNTLTLMSASAVVAAAVVLLGLTAVTRVHAVQTLLLAAAFAGLAVDDMAAWHERGSLKVVALLSLDADFARVLWPVLYCPLLGFVLIALWRIAGRAPKQAGFVIRAGLALLVAAVGAEALWAGWHLSGGAVGDWPDTVQVAFEEGLELGGWILIASGLAAMLVAGLHVTRAEMTEWVRGETLQEGPGLALHRDGHTD